MSIALASLDCLDNISGISLNTPHDYLFDMVAFPPDFLLSGSPRVSPKATWNYLMRDLQITSSLVMANALARTLARSGHELPIDDLRQITEAIASDAEDACGLEHDEANSLSNKLFNQYHRIFADPRLHPVIASLAEIILARKSLSNHDLLDTLRSLRVI